MVSHGLSIGYARGEAPLGFSESTNKTVVEYDDAGSGEKEDLFS